jgi:hypothetical protein
LTSFVSPLQGLEFFGTDSRGVAPGFHVARFQRWELAHGQYEKWVVAMDGAAKGKEGTS